MRWSWDAKIVDCYGDTQRTYHLKAERTYDETSVSAHQYSRAEPLVGDKPAEVDSWEDLSKDVQDCLLRQAEEHAPEPEEERTMPDKDDECRVMDRICDVMRPGRAEAIAEGSDD